MVEQSEVERLSRYLAGELSADEARELERELAQRPELARALGRLERLDELTALAPAPPSAFDAGAAIRRAIAARRRAAFGWRLAGAAGLLIFAGASLGLEAARRAADRRAAAPSGPSVPPPRTLSLAHGEVLLTSGSEGSVDQRGRVIFERGTAWLRGAEVPVALGDVDVFVHGQVVLSTEPPLALARVTEALRNQGDPMHTRVEQWSRAGPMSAVAGGVLALFVIDGHAQVVEPGRGAQRVSEGGTWVRRAVADGSGLAAGAEPALGRSRTALGATEPGKAKEPISLCLIPQSFDPHQLTAAMARVRGEFVSCLDLCRDERCIGQFEARLAISTQGGAAHLRDATIEGDYSIQSPLLASCVLNVLSTVTLPPPTSADAVSLTVPFVVNRANGADGGALTITVPEWKARACEPSIPSTERQSWSEGQAPSRGPADAPVTIVEFSDFECPFCVRAQETLREIERAYSGQLRLVSRQRPMSFHPHARLAAIASLAAHEQGKFWEYRELLMANTNALDRASLEGYARDLGLDAERFHAALSDAKHEAAVAADEVEATRLGVKGVPSFLINGRLVVGARPFEVLKKIIDDELASARPNRGLDATIPPRLRQPTP